jgi:hypothetical protein
MAGQSKVAADKALRTIKGPYPAVPSGLAMCDDTSPHFQEVQIKLALSMSLPKCPSGHKVVGVGGEIYKAIQTKIVFHFLMFASKTAAYEGRV